MADKSEEDKNLASPRFDVITAMFEDVDEVLARHDGESNLTIFEMEILMMMVRKKIDHLGLMASLQLEGGNNPSNGSPEVYR